MKKIMILWATLISVCSFSQTVNDYQYVIVPVKYSFFKENDKYRLNTTTKLMLEKYGFKVFMSNDPAAYQIADNCQKLYADIVEERGLLITRLKLVLKDCKDNLVYETDYGKSREKEYSLAYNEALRQTSKSFDILHYKYNGRNGQAPAVNAKSEPSTAELLPGKVTQVAVSNTGLFFAQPTYTGFQLVDSEPKIVMRLYNTSQQNVFIAEKGSKTGVLISKDGGWAFEYYENGKLISENMTIKF